MAGPKPIVHMYVDDSGTTRGDTFIVGMFCTTEDEAWRKLVQQSLDAERYSNTLHFKQLSANPRQGRYRVSKRLLTLMAARTDWWGHYMYVDRKLVDTSYFSRSAQIEYNKWVADLIRKRTKRTGYEYRVTVAHRDRLRTDDFIPERLQQELDGLTFRDDAPKVSLVTKLSREDRMLQVADLVTSGVHQVYRPSGNPIKGELAGLVDSLIKRHGEGGNRRIYPWEWKPAALVEAENQKRGDAQTADTAPSAANPTNP